MVYEVGLQTSWTQRQCVNINHHRSWINKNLNVEWHKWGSSFTNRLTRHMEWYPILNLKQRVAFRRWLIGFSVNRSLISYMFQSSRNSSWAKTWVLFDAWLAWLIRFAALHVPVLPESFMINYIIRRRNFGFNFYWDSGLPALTEIRMFGPKTANKVCASAWVTDQKWRDRQKKNKDLFSLEIWCFSSKSTRITEASTTWLTVAPHLSFGRRSIIHTTTELGLQPAFSNSPNKYRTRSEERV